MTVYTFFDNVVLCLPLGEVVQVRLKHLPIQIENDARLISSAFVATIAFSLAQFVPPSRETVFFSSLQPDWSLWDRADR